MFTLTGSSLRRPFETPPIRTLNLFKIDGGSVRTGRVTGFVFIKNIICSRIA